jgi:GT2 family glycosyltransferase
MQTTAVVILNWNGIHHLQKYLPSVVLYNDGYQIYIIDNASSDGSMAWVTEQYPDIKRIRLNQNYGFCAGYNQGLKEVHEDFLVLLNSDVRVSPNWTKPIIESFKTNAQLGASQPKILNDLQPSEFEYAGAAGGYLDYLGAPYCRGRIFDTVEKDTAQYNTITNVHWASGAAFFIRNKLFKALNGFDERFFAHMEEIDLCWRLRIEGYEIQCNPNSVVYHLGGGTLHKSNPKKTFLNVRNNLWMLYKNLPRQHKVKILFQKMVLDGIGGLYFLTKGQWRDFLAILKGHFAFYMGKKYIHPNTEEKKMQAWEHHYSKSVIFDYFLRKKKFFTDL